MIEVDSRKEVGEYVLLSKYAHTVNGKKEKWEDAVDRVINMHRSFYSKKIDVAELEKFNDLIDKVTEFYKSRKILGAQRALQYGGELMIEKPSRFYNCCASYLDRVRFFEEGMYLLLCGCGVGYSVQKIHTDKLPIPKGFDLINHTDYLIPDSIEGWSRSLGLVIEAFYYGKPVPKLDYSAIRPKGAFIRGGFSAPGPEPLRKALDKIIGILSKISNRSLTSYELHYIMCISADAVITGGVRRSAMICLFDVFDKQMVECKTGNWIENAPELCRSNNSAAILPSTLKSEFDCIFEKTQHFGEPAFIFITNPDYIFNPCGEVVMKPKFTDEHGDEHSGWGFCNLAEINGGCIETPEDFFAACEAAAIICTLQAGYTDFKVLEKWSKSIAERDALIGVGITGMCENPNVLFNAEIQQKGAEIVKKTNQMVAKLIGINSAARCTVVKPSGNSSQMLGTLSGITLGKSKHYIRNIQGTNDEPLMIKWEKVNPQCVESSFWNPMREKVISFPVTLPDDSLFIKDYSAISFLKLVLLTKNNWIEYGTNFEHPSSILDPTMRMNVSNTCSVLPEEWDGVREFIWDHRNEFSGVSLLSASGDFDYPQSPYIEVLDEIELSKKYGSGAILSSGLIVDAHDVFVDVWQACQAATGKMPSLLSLTDDEVGKFITKHIKNGKFLVTIDGVCFSDVNCVIDHLHHKVSKRKDWVRRFINFSNNYMNSDLTMTANCLNHVNVFHKWQQICRANPVSYEGIVWEDSFKEAGSEIGTACAGGSCELK